MFRAICLLLVTILLTTISLAQETRRVGEVESNPGRANVLQPVELLTYPVVHEELKLTKEQVERLPSVRLAIYKRNTVGIVPPQDEEVRRLARAETAREVERGLREFLTAEQLTRLRQIDVQVTASNRWGMLSGLELSWVAREIRLTDEQKEAIEKVKKDHREAAMRLITVDREENKSRKENYIKELDQKLRTILTEAQLSKWKELTGSELKKAIDLDAHLRPRPGAR